MSDYDEDDKPTVVLDLNALKKQKIKEEEELANIATELEFAVDEEKNNSPKASPAPRQVVIKSSETPKKFPVILFDFQSDLFTKSQSQFPRGYEYQICSSLEELNHQLKNKSFQIVVFNYDANPKAVNQLSAQIKKKFPSTRVLIMARSISPEKARVHSQTAAGASGYYQLPLESNRIEQEFNKIHSQNQKVG